jgi:hypothetical protein
MESSGARGHGDGGGVVFSLSLSMGISPAALSSSVPASGQNAAPSPPQVQTESAQQNLLALVYNLSKFKDPTRFCS